MAAAFDPYYRWLSIPPEDQPANHYQLLGLNSGEQDPDVIENAADQRMNHVRTLRSGPHASLSQQILSELATAKNCLLDPQQKAAYDRSLNLRPQAAPVATRPAAATPAHPVAVARPVLLSKPAATAAPLAAPIPLASPRAAPRAPLAAPRQLSPPLKARASRSRQPSTNRALIYAAAAGAAIILIVGAWQLMSPSSEDAQPVAIAQRPPRTNHDEVPKSADRRLPAEIIEEPVAGNSHPAEIQSVSAQPASTPLESTAADSSDDVSLDALAAGHDPIDLLAKVVLARDAIWGTWRKFDSDLISTTGGETRLQLPCPVPAQYIFEVTVKRERAEPPWEALVLALVVGDHNCGLVIDHREFSALWPVDGRDLHENPTSVRGWQIQGDTPVTIRCLVRPGLVQVEIDGRRLIHFQGDFARLGCGWSMPRRDRLCIGTNSGFTFQRAVLIPLADLPTDEADPPGAELTAADEPVDHAQRLPDEENVKAAAAEVRATFAKDLTAAKRPAEKADLAEKLIHLAKEAENRAERLALWQEGARIAMAGNNPALAIEANDAIVGEFGGDRLQTCADLMEGAAAKELSPAARQELGKMLLARIDEAMAAGRFDVAERLVESALLMARKGGDRAASKEFNRRLDQLRALQARDPEARAARERLAANPDDSAANLELGTFECLLQGDWQAGLPHLAKGAKGPLRAAALQDLASPGDAAQRKKIAEAWWDLAENENELAAEQLRFRAGYWYRQVLAELSGLTKTKVEARLSQVPATMPQVHTFTPIVSSEAGVFLSDLVPEELRLGEGSTLLSLPMVVGEIVSPHSLLTHVITGSSSHVAYRLPGKHRFLVGKVGLNDYIFAQPGQTTSKLTFRVVSNGQDLWKSRPLQIRGESQKFRVDVSGVSKLDLFVDCPGDWSFGQAMWIESRLTNRPDDARAQLTPVVRPAVQPTVAPKISVVEARFGGGNNWVDLTEQFRPLVHDTSLIFTTHISRLVDPTPGWGKALHLRYQLGDKAMEQDWGEDQLVTLGAIAPRVDSANSRGLVIADAAYGAAYVWADKTDLLKGRVQGSQLHVKVLGDWLDIPSDPVAGVRKTLYVRYWFNGVPHLALYGDGDQFTIGQDQ